MASPWAVGGSNLTAAYSEGSGNVCPRTRISLISKMTLLHVGTSWTMGWVSLASIHWNGSENGHICFVCPFLCPSCDRNLLDRVRATFCCHIPMHCSHLSEQFLSHSFHSCGMWHHFSWRLLPDDLRQFGGLKFKDQNVQSNWTFWPITHWCGTTSQKEHRPELHYSRSITT